ncbi:MAG TPA: hypothetical protein VFN10_12665 [Thermoanaerobaculia bacterium]|nr:hypothetical protein [Thermoanaerobaculia bacterium]
MGEIGVEHPESRGEILLCKAQQGGDDAFADIVRAHEPIVFGIALRALRQLILRAETRAPAASASTVDDRSELLARYDGKDQE